MYVCNDPVGSKTSKNFPLAVLTDVLDAVYKDEKIKFTGPLQNVPSNLVYMGKAGRTKIGDHITMPSTEVVAEDGLLALWLAKTVKTVQDVLLGIHPELNTFAREFVDKITTLEAVACYCIKAQAWRYYTWEPKRLPTLFDLKNKKRQQVHAPFWDKTAAFIIGEEIGEGNQQFREKIKMNEKKSKHDNNETEEDETQAETRFTKEEANRRGNEILKRYAPLLRIPSLVDYRTEAGAEWAKRLGVAIKIDD